jgi:predicted RNA-binding protein
MTKPTYWIDLFTGTTWEEFLKAGGNITGFRENRWKTVQQFKPGDFLLCYITGISRFVGVLEVTSKPFKDKTKIWEYDTFPCRVEAKKIVVLTLETAIPVTDFKDKLSIFKNQKSPRSWTSKFRSSPTKLNKHRR